MKSFGKEHWRGIVVILVGIVMFFVYAWFSWSTTTTSFYSCDTEDLMQTVLCQRYGEPTEVLKFNSPDENANFFWALRHARGEAFSFEEPFETTGNNLIRPRSVAVLDNQVGIGSFLGQPLLYGSLANTFSIPGISTEQFILLLTPLMAVIGIWFFYLLIARIFDPNTALVAALLAFVFPGWMYFANRAMYHNVLFVSLLLIGLYAFVRVLQTHTSASRDRHGWWELYLYSFSGFFTGLALITRTSEIGWVGLLFLVILFMHRKQFVPVKRHKIIHWVGLIMFTVFVVVTFVPVLVNNYAFYGTPLSLGYSPGFSGEFSDIVGQRGLLFTMLVSPFGFHPRAILANAYNYLGLLFTHFSIPVLIGFLIWFFARKNTPNKKRQWGYLVAWLVMSAYLLVIYGSWMISDRIDQQALSIGTSYTRYWLPIYLGALPFLAYGMVRFTRLTIRKWARPILIGLFIALLAIPSFRVVFGTTDESLIPLRSNVRDSQGAYLKLREHIPEDAIVMLGFKQADKIFFPHHTRIITELAVPRDYEAVRALADEVPLFYYHFAAQEDVARISQEDFEPYGLRIVNGFKIFGKEWLYRLVVIEPEE